jgi:hypothetical protein
VRAEIISLSLATHGLSPCIWHSTGRLLKIFVLPSWQPQPVAVAAYWQVPILACRTNKEERPPAKRAACALRRIRHRRSAS